MMEFKFKKYIYENPNLIGEPFKISRKQAAETYEKGFPSAREIIDGAKRKYPNGDWSQFDATLSNKKSKGSWGGWRVRNFGSFRIAAACFVLLLLLSYFTFALSGRALAYQALNFFVNLFENNLVITTPENENAFFVSGEDMMFKNGSEFEQATDLFPLILTQEALTVDKLHHYTDEYDVHYLTAYYENQDGISIMTRQEWNHAPISYHDFSKDSGYEELILDEVYSLWIRNDGVNHNIDAVLVLPDSILHLFTDDDYILQLYTSVLKVTLAQQPYKSTNRFPGSRKDSPIIVYYDSFDEVHRLTGFRPFYFDADWLRLDTIAIEVYSLKENMLHSTYKDESGKTVVVHQSWNYNGGMINSHHSLTEYQQKEIGGRHTLYYTYDPMDGQRSGLFIMKDSIIEFVVYDKALFDHLVDELHIEETIQILDTSGLY